MIENPNILTFHVPKLNLDPKKQLVIFGTGEVAECYLKQIISEYGMGKIDFFLDSRNENKFFYDKKILHPCLLKEDPQKNSRTYLLGTFSATIRMKNILIEAGIEAENILEPMKSCSVEAMIKEMEDIHSVFLYPPVHERQQLETLIGKIHYYIPQKTEGNCTFTIDTPLSATEDTQIQIKNSIRQEINYLSYDMILVWNSDCLFDSSIQNFNHVYCIDNHLIENLDVKIFSGIHMILEQMLQDTYRKKSKKNWLDLEQKGLERESYVFGSGPSVSEWINTLKNNSLNGIKIVCNQFHNSKRMMEQINPDLYVLYDYYYFEYGQKEILNEIIEKIKHTKCKLIIPDIFVGVFYKRYNLRDDKLIGIKVQERNNRIFQFPNSEHLEVCFTNNVITALSIPIAASLSRVINVIGCDGRKVNNDDSNVYWEYANELLGAETIYTDMKGKPSHYEEHLKTMENLFLFGEEREKRFYARTKSYIPALRKRLKQ